MRRLGWRGLRGVFCEGGWLGLGRGACGGDELEEWKGEGLRWRIRHSESRRL